MYKTNSMLDNLPTFPHAFTKEQQDAKIRRMCDDNYMRFVGWDQGGYMGTCAKQYFSKDTIDMISKKVTELTMGVDKENRPIIVPDEQICNVMSQVFISNKPKIGDIYTVFIIPDSAPRNDVQLMIDRTIEIITNNIKTTLGMDQWNQSLSIWDTVLGDFNRQGIQQTPRGFAKINRKHPKKMFFFENY